jgi:hypothetical protein
MVGAKKFKGDVMTCRAPNGCPNFPECYAAKECLHAPEDDGVMVVNAYRVGSRFQYFWNGKLIAECDVPTVQAGETLSIIGPMVTW